MENEEKLVKGNVYGCDIYEGSQGVYIGDGFFFNDAITLRNPNNENLEIYKFSGHVLKEGVLSLSNPEKVSAHRVIINKLEEMAKEAGI